MLGLVGLWMYLPPARSALDARGWQPASCRVIENARVEEVLRSGDNEYALRVRYSYTVDRVRHESDVYHAYSNAFAKRGAIDSVAAGLRVGAPVPCFVDPDDPARAALDVTFRPATLMVLGPVAFLLIGVFQLVTTTAWMFREAHKEAMGG